MTIYEEIIKECYWDSNITPKELQELVNSNNYRELKKIFAKIIYNSNDKLKALTIFKRDQLKRLFDDFKINVLVFSLVGILFGFATKKENYKWRKYYAINRCNK